MQTHHSQTQLHREDSVYFDTWVVDNKGTGVMFAWTPVHCSVLTRCRQAATVAEGREFVLLSRVCSWPPFLGARLSFCRFLATVHLSIINRDPFLFLPSILQIRHVRFARTESETTQSRRQVGSCPAVEGHRFGRPPSRHVYQAE